MSYLICDPTCSALMRELTEIDRRRDHLRAQLADAAMHVELAEVDRNLPWGMEPEKKAALKAEREAAIRARIEARAARREKEQLRFGGYMRPYQPPPPCYTRPGTWDDDLDKYPETKYEEDAGDGYRIRLVRARDLTWNAYVILPEDHPVIDRHYSFFGGYEGPAGIPNPPQNITYGGVNPNTDSAAEDSKPRFYGFYLSGTVQPRGDAYEYKSYNFFSVEQTGYNALYGSYYVDYARMRKMALELVDYFKELAANPVTAAICRDAKYCHLCRAFYVGACGGCTPRAAVPVAPAPAPAPASKRSWAAVAAGKKA